MKRCLGWLSRRRELFRYKYPSSLSFGHTNRCNLDCVYCNRRQVAQHKDMDVGDMSISLVERVIDEFVKISEIEPRKKVSVCPEGLGEPLLDKRYFNIVSQIRDKIPKAYIHTNTNGTLLTRGNIIKVASSDLDSVVVSINLWRREDYMAIHGYDYFDEVVRNTISLLKVKDRPRVVIQLLKVSLNESRVEEFKEFWSQYVRYPDKAGLKTFHPQKEIFRKYMSRSELELYLKYFEKEDSMLETPRGPCPNPYSFCHVDNDGWVYPCCSGAGFPHDSDICLGNIEEESLLGMFVGDKIKRLKKLHKQGRWNDLDACSQCDSNLLTRAELFIKLGNRWF